MQKDIQLEVLISFKDQEELNQVPVKGTVWIESQEASQPKQSLCIWDRMGQRTPLKRVLRRVKMRGPTAP